MGLRINQNIEALNAYRNLSATSGQMSKSLEKLSSGFRINRAADDAAGLAISEGLRSQVGGLKMAVRNAQDGVSLVQTAEGALGEVHSMLQRMNELGVQYNNGVNNTDSKAALKNEFDTLKTEIGRITDNTSFNGVKLFDAANSPLSFQVGYASSDKIDVSLETVDVDRARHRLDHGRRRRPGRDHRHLDLAWQPRCAAEPLRAHHQQPQRRGGEPVRVGEPDPRHRHGVGDGELHPLADPEPGRHVDALAGHPGPAERPQAPRLSSPETRLQMCGGVPDRGAPARPWTPRHGAGATTTTEERTRVAWPTRSTVSARSTSRSSSPADVGRGRPAEAAARPSRPSEKRALTALQALNTQVAAIRRQPSRSSAACSSPARLGQPTVSSSSTSVAATARPRHLEPASSPSTSRTSRRRTGCCSARAVSPTQSLADGPSWSPRPTARRHGRPVAPPPRSASWSTRSTPGHDRRDPRRAPSR